VKLNDNQSINQSIYLYQANDTQERIKTLNTLREKTALGRYYRATRTHSCMLDEAVYRTA